MPFVIMKPGIRNINGLRKLSGYYKYRLPTIGKGKSGARDTDINEDRNNQKITPKIYFH